MRRPGAILAIIVFLATAALAVAQAQRSGAAAVLQRRFPSLSLPGPEVLGTTPNLPPLQGALADMAIETYAAESCLLRARKMAERRGEAAQLPAEGEDERGEDEEAGDDRWHRAHGVDNRA